MTLPNEEFLASEQLVYTTSADPFTNSNQKDPQIAQGWQDWQYVGIIALAIGLVVLVRVLSPRVEHAILFAIILSAILIIFFFAT